MTDFAERYGPWAIVAGASKGLGAAFATGSSRPRRQLILAARRSEPLVALADRLPTEAAAVVADLATDDGLESVLAAAANREVGLVVANAAYSPIGSFTRMSLDEPLRALDLNCRATLHLAHHFLPAMAQRRRGGFVIDVFSRRVAGSPPITV